MRNSTGPGPRRTKSSVAWSSGCPADEPVEEEETFYVALAPSGYTGLSDLVDNKVPLVVQDGGRGRRLGRRRLWPWRPGTAS